MVQPILYLIKENDICGEWKEFITWTCIDDGDIYGCNGKVESYGENFRCGQIYNL